MPALIESDVVRVIANVKLNALEVETPVKESITVLVDSISRISLTIERLEWPIKVLLYSIGASGVIYATSKLIQSLRLSSKRGI
jgi:hypothetical protein